MKKNKLFVVPNNDGEALEIQKLLQENGYNYLITQQQWGASWEGLEEEIKKEIQAFTGVVYGIELQGGLDTVNIRLGLATYINIDHHKYDGDDRSNVLSSLEQVANIIGVSLTDYQKAVSDNDKGYIDLMKQHGHSQEIIDAVRLQDRSAQGITREHEEEAERAIKNKNVVNKSLTIIRMKHSKCATVTDRLHGQYENLLIVSVDGECNFYGDKSACEKLHKKHGGWIGGGEQQGFWGGYPKDTITLELEVEVMFLTEEEIKATTNNTEYICGCSAAYKMGGTCNITCGSCNYAIKK